MLIVHTETQSQHMPMAHTQAYAHSTHRTRTAPSYREHLLFFFLFPMNSERLGVSHWLNALGKTCFRSSTSPVAHWLSAQHPDGHWDAGRGLPRQSRAAPVVSQDIQAAEIGSEQAHCVKKAIKLEAEREVRGQGSWSAVGWWAGKGSGEGTFELSTGCKWVRVAVPAPLCIQAELGWPLPPTSSPLPQGPWKCGLCWHPGQGTPVSFGSHTTAGHHWFGEGGSVKVCPVSPTSQTHA